MAARLGPALVGVVCLIVVVGVPGGTAVAQSSPSISLAINQQAVSDGDSIRITEEPSLAIDIEADTTIDVVRVVVDGQARESFSPGTTSFSESIQLSMEDGEHEIRLVVSADGTTTFSVAVLQDRIPPFVSYSAPFTTDKRPPPDTVKVGNGTISLAGQLHDATGVDTIQIERTRRYTHLGTHVNSQSFSISDPGDSFSHEFFLGPDPVQNQFTIAYVDGVGNRREHVTTINVSDNRTPTIDVSHPAESTRRVVTVGGVARDNTQLKEVFLEHQGAKHYSLSEPKPAPNPDNRRVRFSFELSGANALQDGMNDYAVVARDYAGNTERVDFQIRYVFTVEPVIRIDREATSVTDGEIRVVATVDSGEISSVVLESGRPGVDESADLVNIYSGAARQVVDVNRTMELRDGPTEIRIRVVDSNNNEHVKALTVEDGSITFPPEPTPVMPAETGTPQPGGGTRTGTPAGNATGGGGTNATTAPTGNGGSGDGGQAPPAVTNTAVSSRRLPGFGVTDAVAGIAVALATVALARAHRR